MVARSSDVLDLEEPPGNSNEQDEKVWVDGQRSCVNNQMRNYWLLFGNDIAYTILIHVSGFMISMTWPTRLW